MKFPTYEEMAKDVAEKALDEYVYQGKTLREWIQIILESQDEDTISRQKAIDVIDALYLDGDSSASYRASSEGDALIGKYQAITALDDLPPITPQPRTGHWIMHPKGIYSHLVCDKCLSNAPYDCRTNYCPNCGHRMIEPQERSDKE